MRKPRFEVLAHYPMSVWYKIDSLKFEGNLENLAKQMGGKEFGTGTDFKTRDLHYGDFKSERQANAFASRLKRFKSIKRVEVYQTEEN